MKSKNLIYLSLFLFAGLTSCEKYTDIGPETNNTTEVFYSNESQLNQAVIAIYSDLLPRPVLSNWALSDVRSDDTYKADAAAQRDGVDIGLFRLSSQTSSLQGLWDNLYNSIYRSNILLEKIEPFADFSAKTQYQAEARFLRALAYFDLVRFWREVPLITKTLTPEEAKTTPRASQEDLYELIISDLEFAKENLPPSVTEKGRAAKWAAKALLGRVYLTMAGYPLNQKDKLPLAERELADVIAQEGNGFGFAPKFADIFKTANDNKYHVFEIQYAAGGKGLGNPIPGEQPTELPAAWGFAPTGFGFAPSRDLINSWAPGDKRRIATVDTAWTQSGRAVIKDVFTKFVDKENKEAKDRRDYPNNFPVIRYEDVLLMYAEVLNEQAGAGAVPPLKVAAIVNRIRKRAEVPEINPSSTEEMRLAIERERRWEFAGEGLRWHDLVRTGRAIDVLNKYIQTSGQPVLRPVNQNDLLYPIPYKEMNINPGFWTQNNGY